MENVAWPIDNNTAENQIRPMVIWRKTGYLPLQKKKRGQVQIFIV
jgi:hypothetical protein